MDDDSKNNPKDKAGSKSEQGAENLKSDADVGSSSENNATPDTTRDPWVDGASAAESNVGQTRKSSTVSNSNSQTPASSGTLSPGASIKPDLSGENWERDVLNRLAFATLNEQRRSRRWGVFFKALGFIYVGAVIMLAINPFSSRTGGLSGEKHTAVIEITGAIGADTEASADNIVGGLRDAFKDKNTAAVILRINSPGGSPVQAGYVYDEIKRLRGLYPDIKLYAVVADICASGGYYIAAAADEIYADKASIVGSIGVLMNGFGFVEAMKKVGVERRLVTAGKYKGVMDPFSPVKEGELTHVKGMLNSIHEQFIKVVKDGRKDKLKEKQFPDIFSGLFWNGEQSVEMGLVDGLGSTSMVARDVVKVERLVDFTVRSRLFDRFAEKFGVGFAKVVSKTIGTDSIGLK